MCKIMVMAGVNNSNRKLAWEFTRLMAAQMTPGNKDGLGYAAVTTDGELFGERWLINDEAFNQRTVVPEESREEKRIVAMFKGFLIGEEKPIKYNKFGSINEDATAAIVLHTRMATSGKHFMNTHPFVRDNTALIHNGVIGNARDLEIIQSTCDSEAILNEYVNNNVSNNIASIQKVANKLQGYYACGVITETKKYGFVVDIFKDERARLSAAFIRDMGIMVYSTSIDDIVTVCAKMGMEVSHKYVVASGNLMRLSILTGEPLANQKFNPEFQNKRIRKNLSKEELMDSRLLNEDVSYVRGNYLNFPQSWRKE